MVLAAGSWHAPLSLTVANKHLLPVSDRPMTPEHSTMYQEAALKDYYRQIRTDINLVKARRKEDEPQPERQ